MKKQRPSSGTRFIVPLHAPEDASVFCHLPFPFDVQHLSSITHNSLSFFTDSFTSTMDLYARPTIPLSMIPMGDPFSPKSENMIKASDSQSAQPQLAIKRRAPIACRR